MPVSHETASETGTTVARPAQVWAALWSAAHRSPLARQFGALLALVAGAALCARACRGVDWPAALAALRRAGPSVLLLFAAPLVGNCLHMLGWRALLPAELRPAPWRALRIFVAAQAGNELGCGVLGESIKVSALPRGERRRATEAVVLDNLSSLLALFAVLGSVAAFLFHGGKSPILPGSAPAAAVVLSALLVCLALVARRRRASCSARALLGSFVLHYCGKLWIVAEFALALGLLARASARSSALLGLSSTLASSLGTLVPAQLGVVEAALLGCAAAARLSASTVLAVALLRRIRGLLWLLLGGLFLSSLWSKSNIGGSHASIAVDH